MQVDVLGVKFHNLNMEEAVKTALEIIPNRQAVYAVTPNPEIVWNAKTDTALKHALAGAQFVLADGVGITIGAKILGASLKARVPGIDFAEALMKQLASNGQSVFLYGAKPGIAEKAAGQLKEKHPGLQVAGFADGYGKQEDVIRNIQAAKPDFLLVCLGSPKQELWMQENTGKLDVGFMAGLGGALDVFSGTVKRAPKIFQKCGLEWLYRLCKEPWRIKRMIKLPFFLLAVCKKRVFGK